MRTVEPMLLVLPSCSSNLVQLKKFHVTLTPNTSVQVVDLMNLNDLKSKL